MFRTLQAKLLASYALVIFLCIFLTGTSLVLLLSNYQERLALTRLESVAAALAPRLPALLDQPASLQEVATRLDRASERLGQRLALLDAEGVVLKDTGFSLRGATIPLDRREPERRLPGVQQYREASGQEYYLIPLPVTALLAGEEQQNRSLSGFLALVVSSRDVRSGWIDLFPRLLWAGLLSMVVSVAVAAFLAHSITNPLRAMGEAATELAQGRRPGKIDVKGQDETAQLARQFNSMAGEVVRSREAQRDFLANVSHDLRTPLTSIQGFSQAIIDGTASNPQEVSNSAHVILQEAERMDRQVGDLLDLARMDSSQAPVAREQTDLLNLLQRSGDKFARRAKEEDKVFQLNLPPSLPLLLGDPPWLERAFTNLLDNAVKYTPMGGTISLAAMETGAGAVEVLVSDTGPGIPPEDQPRIFERFYRVDKSRAGAEGIGLGLAIVKEIVEAHGGEVGLSSQLGQGSRFTVRLPTLQAPGAGKTKDDQSSS
jgi:signal transduction histidine kinase